MTLHGVAFYITQLKYTLRESKQLVLVQPENIVRNFKIYNKHILVSQLLNCTTIDISIWQSGVICVPFFSLYFSFSLNYRLIISQEILLSEPWTLFSLFIDALRRTSIYPQYVCQYSETLEKSVRDIMVAYLVRLTSGCILCQYIYNS